MKNRFLLTVLLALLMGMLASPAQAQGSRGPYHLWGDGWSSLWAQPANDPPSVMADAMYYIWCDYPPAVAAVTTFDVFLVIDGNTELFHSIGVPTTKPAAPNLIVHWVEPLDPGWHFIQFYGQANAYLMPSEEAFSFYHEMWVYVP